MGSVFMKGKQGNRLALSGTVLGVFVSGLLGAFPAHAEIEGPGSLFLKSKLPQAGSLPIAACKREFSGSEGKDIYICFDDQGKEILRVPVDQAKAESRFGLTHLAAYLKAYQNACYFKGPLPDLARSAFGALGLPKAWPDSSCLNIDRSMARFSQKGANYVYTVSQAPGGGNAHGTIWSLRVTPPRTDLLQVQAFPFLLCPEFYASEYCQWHLRVKKDDKSLLISADDIAQPCQKTFAWADVLARLAQQFKGCPAKALP